MMQKMLGVLHIKKGDDERIAQMEAIQRVSTEFEKVYTSVNKLNSSITEGTEQMASHVDNMKRKLQELKKLLITQPDGSISSDAAAKNAQMVKLQDKARSLKAQGKMDQLPDIEKQIAKCAEEFQTLMSPDAAIAQKGAVCRAIVGIVDNLGQISFRNLSDQFAVRDSIKLYIVSVVDAYKVATGGKKKPETKADKDKKEKKEGEEKEEKGTVERMASSLIKCAGMFLEFGKQVAVDLPPEYESYIKAPANGAGSTAPTIADHTKNVDAQIRTINGIVRNDKDFDALVVDNLIKSIDDVMSTMKKLDALVNNYHTPIQQAVKESQAAICVAQYEANPGAFKIPPIRSLDEAIAKLKILIKVMHEYLVPSLVATPLVYLNDKDWTMKSHSDFRAAKRKELKDLEPHVIANMPLDALRECIIEFSQVLTAVLHIKIPMMMEVHPDDSSIFHRIKWGPERQAMRDEVAAEVEKLQNAKTKNNPNTICMVVQNLVRIVMRFLTYKPVGRPHVFRSDAEWRLVSESKLRFQLRKELLL